MAAQIITEYTQSLVGAFSECVLTVADYCLAKELITDDLYKEVLHSSDSNDDKARILLNAIKDAIAMKNDCFDTFIEILNLPELFPPLVVAATTPDSERKSVKYRLVLEIEKKYEIFKRSYVHEDVTEKEQPVNSTESMDHPTAASPQDGSEDHTPQSPIPGHDETLHMIRVIQIFTPRLVCAISNNVHPVLDKCLSEGLITEGVYKKLLESVGSEDKARFLLQAIKGSIQTDKRCFKIFVDVLEEKLPPAHRENFISEITDQLQKLYPKADDTDATQEQQYDIKAALTKVQELTEKCAQVSHEKAIVEKELAAKIKENKELKAKLNVLEREGQHEEIKKLKEKIEERESEIKELNITVKQKEAIIEEHRMHIKREQTMAHREIIIYVQKEAKDYELKTAIELEDLKTKNFNLKKEAEQLRQEIGRQSCCYHCGMCHHFNISTHHPSDQCGFFCRLLGLHHHYPRNPCSCPSCKCCNPDYH